MRKLSVLFHYLNYQAFLRLLLLIFALVLLFGTTMRLIEPDTFRTILDGIYWAIVTAGTIGYGDFVPHTTVGKIVTVFYILVGTAAAMYYFTQIAAFTIQTQDKEKQGEHAFVGNGHLIIVGWNERTKNLIHQLIESKITSRIVLIDHSLAENPYTEKIVNFVKGQSYYDYILELANIKEASSVIITSDHQLISEVQADMRSVMTILAIRGLNSDIPITVELLTPDQANNAKRAGADEIIETSSIISSALFDKMNQM